MHPQLVILSALAFVEQLPESDRTLEPPNLKPVAFFRLREAWPAGSVNLTGLLPCGRHMAAFSSLRIGADSSANEEIVLVSASCTTCESCVASSSIRYDHGRGELVRLMPDTFQLPAGGGRLYAQPEIVQGGPQHERAAAIVVRAERWISLSVRTLTSGPNKWALRSLLFGLMLILLGGCVCAALFKVLFVMLRKTSS